MTKKASRQAITKRIVKALEYFGKGDMEEALYNIAPVIDVIAKERFKDKKGVGERIKAFLFEEQSIIYNLSTQGRMPLKDGVKLVFVDKNHQPISERGGELADIIYHHIRCAQSHDAEIDYSTIELGRDFGIGYFKFEGDGGEKEPKKFIISNATVIALILATIYAKENKRIKLTGSIVLFGKATIEIEKLISNKKYLENILKDLFKKSN